jgi:hypothetical protein
MLAARGHSGARAVVSHPQVQEKLGARIPLPTSPPVPAPVKAVTPPPPRVAVPAAPQPSPMLDGVARKVDTLTQILSPEVPPGLLD